MSRSRTLYDTAKRYIPGGVNSPVRAFAGVGGTPVFFKKAKGAYLYDEDDREYVDYVGAWGPMIMGHNAPPVMEAITRQLEHGLSFGAPTEIETQLAEKICQLMPAIEQIRMVNSGTEATMSAIRLARGYTGRDTIIKFTGCYHGHSDALLVKAGSGPLTLGVPSSPGVPAAMTEHTLSLVYNDIDSVRECFKERGDQIAAIIVEPVAGNMNCIPPVAGFLEGLRQLCDEYQSVLIFDEVMTGFRVALGGAQAHYQIQPDLTTLGKIIGGGMPVGAFGGRRHIMKQIAPSGPIYQAGTLSGCPVAMAAGLALLNAITDPRVHQDLTRTTQQLTHSLKALAQTSGIPLTVQHVGGMFGLFFTEQPKIEKFSQLADCDIERFKRFYHLMLEAGIYLAPSAYEAGFISTCHGEKEIEKTLLAAQRAFTILADDAA